jgi:peptidoglycan-associated lipoprotein
MESTCMQIQKISSKCNAVLARIVCVSAVSIASLLVAACGSSIKLDDSVAGAPIESRGGLTGKGSGSTGAGGPAGTGAADPNRVGQINLPDNAQQKALLDKRSIYFEYDSFSIRPADQAVIEAHARDLIAGKKKVLIQGHTDERGSSEYNIALGNKRAEAVKRALASLGVTESQMEAVSLGKEKPKAQGSTEEAFAENRRADLVY